ncbi:hypothetical protein QCA50_005184 [Cerrena zonata]|uniref:Uncharacterized protein n=1 Tax=Cerrena zonata TaxID=2478898 RepID=A0AAW0GGA1_9APHY
MRFTILSVLALVAAVPVFSAPIPGSTVLEARGIAKSFDYPLSEYDPNAPTPTSTSSHAPLFTPAYPIIMS